MSHMEREISSWMKLLILLGRPSSYTGLFVLTIGMTVVMTISVNAEISVFPDKERTISVPGTIVNISETNARENKVPVMKYEYEFTDKRGVLHKSVSYANGAQYSVGEMIVLEYAEDNPDSSVINGMRRKPYSSGAVVFFVLPFVAILFLIYGIRKSRKEIRLLRSGLITKGSYLSEEETFIRVNGRKVINMTFAYSDQHNKRHCVQIKTHQPEKIKKSQQYHVFYNPDDPQDAILLEAVPFSRRLPEGFVS